MLDKLFQFFSRPKRKANEARTAGERLAAYERGEINEFRGGVRDWMPPKMQLETPVEVIARHEELLRSRFGQEPAEGDVRWSVLQEEYAEAVMCKQWLEATFCLIGMANLLADEKRWESSLAQALAVLIYKVNGPNNLHCIDGVVDPIQLIDSEFDIENRLASHDVSYSDIRHQVEALGYGIDDIEICFWSSSKSYWMPRMPLSVEETWLAIKKGLVQSWPNSGGQK